MTTQLLERPDIDEALDLSDLDLLDESHIYCACTPAPGIAIAACGKRGFVRGLPVTPERFATACPKCQEDWQKPCPRCGE